MFGCVFKRDLISLRHILTYSQMTTLGFASEESSRNEGKSGGGREEKKDWTGQVLIIGYGGIHRTILCTIEYV